MALNDAKIRNTKPAEKPFKLTDGHGLYLEVRPTGAKLWRYRYRIAGKENVFAIGAHCRAPAGETEAQATNRRASGRYTLAEARVERDRCRGLIKQGIHPAHHRKLEKATRVAEHANTFEAVAREWIEDRSKKKGWTDHYRRQVEQVLKDDVFPYIGALPIRQVTAAHLLEIVRRIEGRGAETIALLVRQWCSAIFRYAVGTLRADSDPAAALKDAITRPKTRHRKPLSRADIVRLLQKLDADAGHRTTVIALRLAMLTFVRTVELRMAQWSEFDLERAEWRIPAERMKMREPHTVPLSQQAIALLRELQTLTGGQCWLFPNYRRPDTCMTATTLNRALQRMGFHGQGSIGFSAHGFRATACTMLNEMGYRPDVIERQLAHGERNKVRASYNRAEFLDERRNMMQAWADYLDGLVQGATVIPLRGEVISYERS
jgi:integrase